MLRTLMTLGFLAIPTLALAQDNGGLDISLREIVAVLITGVGVPLAVQLLKHFWPKAPSWLKAIAGPIIVPGLVYAAGRLSGWLGMPISFQDIIAVITGAAVISGAGSTVAFTLGKKKG